MIKWFVVIAMAGAQFFSFPANAGEKRIEPMKGAKDKLKPFLPNYMLEDFIEQTSCVRHIGELAKYGEISFQHMTNYTAGATVQWYGGWTTGSLSVGSNGHLTGTGKQLASNRESPPCDCDTKPNYHQEFTENTLQPFAITSPKEISYDIDPKGKISINGKGPYNMICLGHIGYSYVVVITGSSIETLFFRETKEPTGPD